jgi:hypothetical protein
MKHSLTIALLAGLTLLISALLLCSKADNSKPLTPHLVAGSDSAKEAATPATAVDSSTPRLPDEFSGTPNPDATANVIKDLTRSDLAAQFGITDYGLLNEEEKAKVLHRINRELAGVLKVLSDPNTDEEATCTATISMLKYQEGLALLQENSYLTTDPVALLRNQVGDYDPITLFSAANLDGKRVAVVLPVRIKPGSELEAMREFAKSVAEQRVSKIIMEFNSQPPEVRAQKVRDMMEAKSQLEAWHTKRARGEITGGELMQHMQELNPRLPPRGITVDVNSNLLRD